MNFVLWNDLDDRKASIMFTEAEKGKQNTLRMQAISCKLFLMLRYRCGHLCVQ